MKKKIILLFLFLSVSFVYSQNSISGQYFIGEQKASIYADEMAYWLSFENESPAYRLAYEENNLENDQIWTVWKNGKQSATLVIKSDYSSGTYTDYRTDKESFVKKIP